MVLDNNIAKGGEKRVFSLQSGGAKERRGLRSMRIRILVVVVTAMMVISATVSALPAVAQPYPDLGFIDDLVDELVEGANECGWYWDERYGWQYWCWSSYYGWYLPDSCVNQAWQQNNGHPGATNYSYQSCDVSK